MFVELNSVGTYYPFKVVSDFVLYFVDDVPTVVDTYTLNLLFVLFAKSSNS